MTGSGAARRGLSAALLATALAYALLRYGAVASWTLARLFLLVALAALPAALAPLDRDRDRARPVVLAVLALLLVPAALRPPFFAQGFLLAGAGVLTLWLVDQLVAGDRRRAFVVFGAAVAVGALEAAYGVVQSLHDPRHLAAVLAQGTGRLATGTLVNPNHFAGLLVLALGAALGLLPAALRRRRRRFRGALPARLLTAAAVLTAAAIVLSGSRGGMAVAALVGAVALPGLRREVAPRRRTAVTVAAALLAGALAVAATAALLYPAESGVARRWGIYGEVVAMIADHPWTGVGPGLFPWRFRPYQEHDVHKRFVHAHDDYLETAAEWGVPAALAVFLFCAVRWGRAAHRAVLARDPRDRALGRAASLALLAGLVHVTIDFDLQIPALRLVFAALLGAAWSLEARLLPASRPTRRARLPAVRRALYAGLTLLLLFAGWRVGRRVATMERALRAVEAGELAGFVDPRWPPFSFRLGVTFRDDPTRRDLRQAHRHLGDAVALNPYSWRYRSELARLYEDAGQVERAEAAYRAALTLNPRSAEELLRVAGFYLRRGDPARARTLLADAAARDPALLEPAGDLLLTSGVTPAEVAAWWPGEPAAAPALLRVLCRAREAGHSVSPGLLDRTWQRWLRTSPPPDAEAGSSYVAFLRRRGDLEAARRAWSELAAAGGRRDPLFAAGANAVWNGGFELPLAGGELGWQAPPDLGVRLVREASGGRAGSGGWALRIDFAEAGKLHFPRLRQLILVESGRWYELSVDVRSARLESPAGVYLQLWDPASRRVLYATPAIRGTIPWHHATGTFRAPEASTSAVLRLAAPRGPGGARQIRGSLWLDSIVVRPLPAAGAPAR